VSTLPAPIVAAHNLRVDLDGCVLCEQLTLEADADRSVLVGTGACAIARAVTLRGQISRGTLRVAGYDVGTQQHLGKIGLAPLDPPLPPRMTVLEFFALSFQAAGCSARRSRDLAAVALQEAAVPSLATRHTESLALPERRASPSRGICPTSRSWLRLRRPPTSFTSRRNRVPSSLRWSPWSTRCRPKMLARAAPPLLPPAAALQELSHHER
jgi:ABC-2 type transport system ATP-binding protein